MMCMMISKPPLMVLPSSLTWIQKLPIALLSAKNQMSILGWQFLWLLYNGGGWQSHKVC
jgi:hypothetical protein